MEVPQVDWIVPLPGTDDLLQTVYDDALRWLVGCTRGEADELLELVVRLMNCQKPSDFTTAGYVSIMTMFPRDLLLPSIHAAVAAERYHVLPAPGALVAMARSELDLRQRKLSRLRMAIARLALARRFREVGHEQRSRTARVNGTGR
jgi:hypothetical protein